MILLQACKKKLSTLLQPRDHVARMARFALNCVAAANKTLIDADDPGKGFVSIRAGFHTGPVVANVVGTKYRYVQKCCFVQELIQDLISIKCLKCNWNEMNSAATYLE